tara:strand:- start:1261 stop:2220 length:960 start_codon:yes stop_codon:yes gene_type:complete
VYKNVFPNGHDVATKGATKHNLPIDCMNDLGSFELLNASLTKTFTLRVPIIEFTRNSDGVKAKLRPVKLLGKGAYGMVVLYRHPHGSYAVKIEMNQSEQPVIQKLRGIDCGQINARIIGSVKLGKNSYYFSILEIMDGPISRNMLLNFAKSRGIKGTSMEQRRVRAAAMIVEEVRRQVVCLLKNNSSHVYTDMKMGNVLFRNVSGKVSIKVGDLGSIVPVNYGDYAFTFPCLPNGKAFRNFKSITEKRQCIAFQLGLLLASLLGIDISHFHFKQTRKNKDTSQLASFMVHMLHEVGMARLSKLVHNDPSKRPSIMTKFV